MRNNAHRTILKMTGVALFAALSFVLTTYAMIPYPGGMGYFNFGDIVDLVAAFLFGPIGGMVVGMVGGAISDLLFNDAFVLWTLLAKGLLGFAAGGGFLLFKKRRILRFAGGFAGAALEVIVYLLAYLVLEGYGALYQSVFDCLQAFGSWAVAIPVYLFLEKAHLPERITT